MSFNAETVQLYKSIQEYQSLIAEMEDIIKTDIAEYAKQYEADKAEVQKRRNDNGKLQGELSLLSKQPTTKVTKGQVQTAESRVEQLQAEYPAAVWENEQMERETAAIRQRNLEMSLFWVNLQTELKETENRVGELQNQHDEFTAQYGGSQ